MEACVVVHRILCAFLFFLAPALLLLLQQLKPCEAQSSTTVAGNATWTLLLENAGIASMHTAVTYMGPVIFLDRTDIGPSQIALADDRCRNDSLDQTDTFDCSAHSVMFDPDTNTVRPLYISTDTWCSSGQFLPNGTLLQTGGFNDGVQKIRWLDPCAANETCDWVESDTDVLQAGRWYATNQLLPDGSTFVLGGQYSNAYEFLPADGSLLYNLDLLSSQGYFDWYPFVHLLPDGNLWIFANRDSILFDYTHDVVLQNYPTIPGEPRNYPCAGSSVLLALDGDYTEAEVMVCGGASIMAPGNVTAQYPASQTCGRMVVTSPNASWTMIEMPIRRNMGDMVLLPTSEVTLLAHTPTFFFPPMLCELLPSDIVLKLCFQCHVNRFHLTLSWKLCFQSHVNRFHLALFKNFINLPSFLLASSVVLLCCSPFRCIFSQGCPMWCESCNIVCTFKSFSNTDNQWSSKWCTRMEYSNKCSI
jgi:hypothetical protein